MLFAKHVLMTRLHHLTISCEADEKKNKNDFELEPMRKKVWVTNFFRILFSLVSFFSDCKINQEDISFYDGTLNDCLQR